MKDIVIVIVCVIFVLKLCDINLFHNIPINQKYFPSEHNTNTHGYLASQHLKNVDQLSNKMLKMVNRAI